MQLGGTFNIVPALSSSQSRCVVLGKKSSLFPSLACATLFRPYFLLMAAIVDYLIRCFTSTFVWMGISDSSSAFMY